MVYEADGAKLVLNTLEGAIIGRGSVYEMGNKPQNALEILAIHTKTQKLNKAIHFIFEMDMMLTFLMTQKLRSFSNKNQTFLILVYVNC